jgi:hypothetical protein
MIDLPLALVPATLMEEIPDDIIWHIYSYLDTKTLLSMSLVSKSHRLSYLSNCNVLWHDRFEQLSQINHYSHIISSHQHELSSFAANLDNPYQTTYKELVSAVCAEYIKAYRRKIKAIKQTADDSKKVLGTMNFCARLDSNNFPRYSMYLS